MGKLLAVLEREYTERVRSKWFLVATFLGPVILGALMILPAYLISKTKPSVDVAHIAVLDASRTNLGRRVAASLVGPLGDTSAVRVIAVTSATLPAADS